MITPARNEPCPCGSGRKFKQCHGAPKAKPAEGSTWEDIRRVLAGYPGMIMRFVSQAYGPEALEEAWEAFMTWPDEPEPFDDSSPLLPLFVPWFYHRWAPDPHGTDVEDESLHDVPPTAALLKRRASRLEPLLRRYLQACVEAPFSFFELTEVTPGSGFRCRNLINGAEHHVTERSASRTMKGGEALFGQLVTCDGVTIMEAAGPYMVPPRHMVGLLDLCAQVEKSMEVTGADLEDWDIELREAYLDIVHMLTSPPVMQNTDGDDIVFMRVVFEIDSVSRAYNALRDIGPPDEGGLDDVEYDEHDEVSAVAFPWMRMGNAKHRSWGNTILGNVEIHGTILEVTTNSAERAERFRNLVEERLGENARFIDSYATSLDDAAAALEEDDSDEGWDD